ncbi:MAG: dynamin family protein [Oscillochloridaceae bacterium umkhey_bin13]
MSETSPASDEAQPRNLLDLQKTKQGMINGLRRLREIVEYLNQTPGETALIDEMLDRIENHRFTIAVVGEFKRGKSTFVNALLGEEVLPADVLPTTATLNRVTFDDLRPRVELVYRGEHGEAERREEIGLRELPQYVTKLNRDAAHRAAQIREAVVYYNNRFLRKHVDIIDTPGLNDDDTMTAVTMSVLPSVDAVIMMTIPVNPFGGYEGEFLNKLMLGDMGRVLFVVNQIDSIAEEDRQRLLDNISERIEKSIRRKAEERFGTGPELADERDLYIKRIGRPQVFGISAADALDARLASPQDNDLLEASRFVSFEEKLEHFLTYDRGIVTLQSLAARIVTTGRKLQQQIDQEINAATLSQEDFEHAVNTASKDLEELRRQLSEELDRIDQSIELTSQKARSALVRLGDEIMRAAEQAINSAPIRPPEITKEHQPQLIERLNHEVGVAVEVALRSVIERAQILAQREFEHATQQFNSFVSALDRGFNEIDLRFARPLQDDPNAIGMKGRIVQMASGGTMFVGGSFASIVAVSMFGSALVATAPITFLLMVIGSVGFVGAGSLAFGRAIKEKVFANDRVESFRKAYRDAVLVQIEQQAQAKQPEIERHFDQHVRDMFLGFRRQVETELGTAIEQRRTQLLDLRDRRTRNEAMTEVQLDELRRLQSEITRLIGKAHGLSGQLSEITEV